MTTETVHNPGPKSTLDASNLGGLILGGLKLALKAVIGTVAMVFVVYFWAYVGDYHLKSGYPLILLAVGPLLSSLTISLFLIRDFGCKFGVPLPKTFGQFAKLFCFLAPWVCLAIFMSAVLLGSLDDFHFDNPDFENTVYFLSPVLISVFVSVKFRKTKPYLTCLVVLLSGPLFALCGTLVIFAIDLAGFLVSLLVFALLFPFLLAILKHA